MGRKTKGMNKSFLFCWLSLDDVDLFTSIVSAFSGCNSVLKSCGTATLTTKIMCEKKQKEQWKRWHNYLCDDGDKSNEKPLRITQITHLEVWKQLFFSLQRYKSTTLMSKLSKLCGIRWYSNVLSGLLMVQTSPMNMLSSTAPLGSSARASNLHTDHQRKVRAHPLKKKEYLLNTLHYITIDYSTVSQDKIPTLLSDRQ